MVHPRECNPDVSDLVTGTSRVDSMSESAAWQMSIYYAAE